MKGSDASRGVLQAFSKLDIGRRLHPIRTASSICKTPLPRYWNRRKPEY